MKAEGEKWKYNNKYIIFGTYGIFLSVKPTYFLFLKWRHHPEYESHIGCNFCV